MVNVKRVVLYFNCYLDHIIVSDVSVIFFVKE